MDDFHSLSHVWHLGCAVIVGLDQGRRGSPWKSSLPYLVAPLLPHGKMTP